MTEKPTGKRIEREAKLRWVPIAKMRVNALAQRELNMARVDKIVSEMDLEQLGAPTVSERDGWFYIIDGQHRIAAYKKWAGEGWNGETFQCWTYSALSEEEEAEKFLKLNDTLSVRLFDEFRVAVQAGRETESDINRIVLAQGLRVSTEGVNGAIRAVGTLRRIYKRSGPGVLQRTLAILRDAYGDPGLEGVVLDGFGLLCGRYNGAIDDVSLITKLANARGGVSGLLGNAEVIRQKTGKPKSHCVASEAVRIYNAGRGGGKKLTPWWKSEEA